MDFSLELTAKFRGKIEAMGGSLSCKSRPTFNCSIRVVHLNGKVEDFEYPVSAAQVTGSSPKFFVCTAAQLLSTDSKPLKPETVLEPGKIYFLLPYSTIQGQASPLDLVSLVKKLTSIAKSRRRCSQQASKSAGTSPSSSRWGSPMNSPARSPNRLQQDPGAYVMAYGAKSCGAARSWRPLLETIREKSFNRRTESEVLQETQLESLKLDQISG